MRFLRTAPRAGFFGAFFTRADDNIELWTALHYKRPHAPLRRRGHRLGPRRENGAIQAAFSGKKVALIEKEAVPGGASANTGTIPSKALRETALAIKQARSRDAHGIELRVSGTVTIPELMGRRGLVTAREHSRIRNALNRAGVESSAGSRASWTRTRSG